jgi:hypothetical protein
VGLVNGAKGVMPWSVYHNVESELRAKKKAEGKPAWEEWYLPDSKELWAECGAMAKELKDLAPLLLDGKRTKLAAGDDLSAAVWVGEKESVVIVANLSETKSTKVAVALPKGTGTELVAAFKGRPTGLKLNDGKLTGELGKAEVQVYRLNR